uniref:Kringle domain-containing protein n=1 Tax=Hippocampus comes TaxID=109280 RepID=A0A3Q2XHC6_HIPCM
MIAIRRQCYEDNGEAYRGTLSITRSGIPCANCIYICVFYSGDSHSTLSHVGLDKNYCRNPDRDKHGPWCYTDPNTRLAWDYCKLKHCEWKYLFYDWGSPKVKILISKNGLQSVLESGILCSV